MVVECHSAADYCQFALSKCHSAAEKYRSEKYRSEKYRSEKYRSEKYRSEKYRSEKYRSETEHRRLASPIGRLGRSVGFVVAPPECTFPFGQGAASRASAPSDSLALAFPDGF